LSHYGCFDRSCYDCFCLLHLSLIFDICFLWSCLNRNGSIFCHRWWLLSGNFMPTIATYLFNVFTAVENAPRSAYCFHQLLLGGS
jgi:hypothetical protein